MLRAFADGEDVRIGRLQVVIDDDSAPYFETRLTRQIRIGANSCGDHDQIGFQFFARCETQTVNPSVAEQR